MKPNVLVIHDDPIVARSWGASLRNRGFQVAIASDYGAVFDHEPFDVLVAARELGARTGFDLIAALAVERPEARAILVAPEPGVDDYRRALAVGARAVVAEPAGLEELQESIELACEPLPALPQRGRGRSFRWSGLAGRNSASQTTRELLGFLLARGIGPALRARIGTAAIEVLENAWEHAYFETPGPVHVQAQVTKREISVVIRDEGTGFDALAVSACAFDGCTESGLARAAALVEDLRIESDRNSGTCITLTFGTYGVAFDDDDRFDLSDHDWMPSELARRVHSGDIDDAVENIPPALAVVIGRLLSGPTRVFDAMRSLWG